MLPSVLPPQCVIYLIITGATKPTMPAQLVGSVVLHINNTKSRSSNSIVGYAVVYILRLIGHTHDRESPIQNFSTAPKKLGAHISSPVWPPKPTEFVSYLGNLRCDAFTALKSVQSARNDSFLAGSDNFHRVLTAIEFEA